MTTSNAEGNFVFKALPAGEYEMKVLKPGFAVYRAPHVALEPGRDLAMTVKLEIGSLTENVDVQAEGATKASPSAEAASKPKPTRIRIGGNVEAAKVLHKVQPIYPDRARSAGVQGSVVLHVIVGVITPSPERRRLLAARMRRHPLRYAANARSGRVAV